VVASRTSPGNSGGKQQQIRSSLDAVTARNPNIRVRRDASGHGAILRRDFRAVAEAVREPPLSIMRISRKMASGLSFGRAARGHAWPITRAEKCREFHHL
jgi:hypothetical protein